MKQALEIVVVVAAVLLAAVLFRELHARAGARDGGAVGVGETSDPPVAGSPRPTPGVQVLPPFRERSQARVLRTDAPPPPATTSN